MGKYSYDSKPIGGIHIVDDYDNIYDYDSKPIGGISLVDDGYDVYNYEDKPIGGLSDYEDYDCNDVYEPLIHHFKDD